MIGLIFGDTDFPKEILKTIKKKKIKYLIIDLSKSNKFNQDRINEIETIALENPYYDLRQWIALSYITKSDVRELNSENFKKAFNNIIFKPHRSF